MTEYNNKHLIQNHKHTVPGFVFWGPQVGLFDDQISTPFYQILRYWKWRSDSVSKYYLGKSTEQAASDKQLLPYKPTQYYGATLSGHYSVNNVI